MLPVTSSEGGSIPALPRTPQKRKTVLTKDGRLTTEFALSAAAAAGDPRPGLIDISSAGARGGSYRGVVSGAGGLNSDGYGSIGFGGGGDDDGFLPDAGFEFDIDGNLIDLSETRDGVRREGAAAGMSVSDAALNTQVRREHEEARRAATTAATARLVSGQYCTVLGRTIST